MREPTCPGSGVLLFMLFELSMVRIKLGAGGVTVMDPAGACARGKGAAMTGARVRRPQAPRAAQIWRG